VRDGPYGLPEHGAVSELRAAILGETLPGTVDQLLVVAFERFYHGALKESGKCPERCLFPWHQFGVDMACPLPTMEQLEQNESLIGGESHGHFWHA
jgi:hypothetical protein